MKWVFTAPGVVETIFQLLLVALLHDIFFTFIHYVVHKVPSLRISHLRWHHECPFDVGSSRCALASEGIELAVRDLYSVIVPTYIMGYCGMPFNGHLWVPYYSLYSLWTMYVHTGVNKYHRLHYESNPNRNYGLYYITDYFMGTLNLD